MNVLVTGGAGFIGSHLVDALIARGDQVAVVDNLSTGNRRNLNPKAAFHQADITEKAAMERVFEAERPDYLSHHAAQTDVRRSMADMPADATINILGSLNILGLAVKHGVKKLTFASTSAVYPDPLYLPMDEGHLVRPASAYGVSKFSIENYLYLLAGEYRIKFTAFRYGNVYGPRQDPHGECGVVAIFSGQMLTGVRPTIFGDGSKTRDYIHVGDIVSANLMALDGAGDNDVFNIGWGKEVSDYQIFRGVADAVGYKTEPIFGTKRPGENERVCLDVAKARAKMGWEPRVTLAEGMKSTTDYYRAQYGQKQGAALHP